MATILKVHDGDSFLADVDLGFHVSERMWLRLAGVNTPELNTPEGHAARAFVVDWLFKDKPMQAPVVEITTVRDRQGDEKQTFGRYVAHVHNAMGESLAEALVAAGHGKVIKT
jgi:endonuclease YncB( thermonuclease family)